LGLFRGSRGSQLELQLGLGSTDEGLEDSRVGVVEDDIAAGRVGIALEDDGLVGGDAEKVAELDRKRVCTQVLEGQLESLGAVVERDLDGDEGVLIHWACG